MWGRMQLHVWKFLVSLFLTGQGQKKSHIHWTSTILTLKHQQNNLKKNSAGSHLAFQQACTEHITRTCSLHQFTTWCVLCINLKYDVHQWLRERFLLGGAPEKTTIAAFFERWTWFFWSTWWRRGGTGAGCLAKTCWTSILFWTVSMGMEKVNERRQEGRWEALRKVGERHHTK